VWSYDKGSPLDVTALEELLCSSLHRFMISFSEARVKEEELAQIGEKKKEADVVVEQKGYGWKKAHTKLRKETALENHLLKPRCYLENVTEEEKKECAEEFLHMRYDEEADYGFFE
jgi:hypothetical protein